MKRVLAALAMAATGALPALAAAAEGGEPSIFAGDLGNMVWTVVTFVLLLWVLGRYAWGPILERLQAREQFIRESLEEAKENRQEAEARLKEYEARLASARAEATEIVDEGRRDAEQVAQRVEEEAKQEAEKIVARARREIELAKEAAVKELFGIAGELATGVAEKIVRRELRAEDHQRLIDESLAAIRERRSAGN